MCNDEMLSTISDVVKSYVGIRPRGAFLMCFTHDDTGNPYTDDQADRHLDGWIDMQNELDAMDRDDSERHEWNSECEDRIYNGNAIPGIHFPGSGRNWELVTE